MGGAERECASVTVVRERGGGYRVCRVVLVARGRTDAVTMGRGGRGRWSPTLAGDPSIARLSRSPQLSSHSTAQHEVRSRGQHSAQHSEHHPRTTHRSSSSDSSRSGIWNNRCSEEAGRKARERTLRQPRSGDDQTAHDRSALLIDVRLPRHAARRCRRLSVPSLSIACCCSPSCHCSAPLIPDFKCMTHRSRAPQPIADRCRC